ncbi:MAG: hypothetical protein KA956_15770 [Pyrinomonadaceae bacterium]|nr:hypothetical protein [Acidobacteriota bacterium]MBP7377926.1 hypothetical protein [Pyrinomonadaceae bacterium]
MLDENLIGTLEQSLRQTRNAQNRLMGRLREAENEVELLREEIDALEKSASQTEQAIDSLLVTMRSGSRRSSPSTMRIDDEYEISQSTDRPQPSFERPSPINRESARGHGTVAYLSQHRSVPSRSTNMEPLSSRFSDRTITQACTLLLREAGRPLHVNELYNLLISGGMKFKGNNPTISVAVSLSRNKRFRKVDPGTFDLDMRDVGQSRYIA